MEESEYNFLIHMYDQVWNNINRHILTSWQSISVIAAAIASFLLIENNVINYNFALLALFVICRWSIHHIYDTAQWFHRNICITSNIERILLKNYSSHDIHPYIGKHRDPEKILTHLKIQMQLPICMILISFAYFIYKQINIGTNFLNISIGVILLITFFAESYKLKMKVKMKNQKFNELSPGIARG